MRHLVAIELHDVVSWLVANIPATITSMLCDYTDGAKMIAAHPHEALRDSDFITNFEFHRPKCLLNIIKSIDSI